MTRIYLDHSATTPVDPRVLEAMLPFYSEHFGNSMAIHELGRVAETSIEQARTSIAQLLNCEPHDVVFTSGGTESDNLALRGPAQYARANNIPFTLVTSPLEHAAISSTARQLRDVLGASLRIVPVDQFGRINPDDLRATLHNLPAGGITVVSLIHAHNEIGTRNPIELYATIAHEYGAYFHTDAVQSPAYFTINVIAMEIDMLSLSSHKFYGPKGTGVLVLRDNVPFLTAQTGAKHEDYRRAGTHNTPGIVGMARALELVIAEREAVVPRLVTLQEHLIDGILATVPDAELTGDPFDRLPGHASFAFKHVDSNTLLMHLDRHGIAASSGSACKSGNERPSTILETLGYGPEWTRGGLRLSMGHNTTESDITSVLDVLPRAVESVRRLRARVFPS